MPLYFWAAQTSVAASNLGVGIGRLAFTTYLPPHTAATAIQRAHHSHVVNKSINGQGWQISLEEAKFKLERDMFRAMAVAVAVAVALAVALAVAVAVATAVATAVAMAVTVAMAVRQ
jgi:hypothetical protein